MIMMSDMFKPIFMLVTFFGLINGIIISISITAILICKVIHLKRSIDDPRYFRKMFCKEKEPFEHEKKIHEGYDTFSIGGK